MSIFDLVLIVSFLVVVLGLLGLLIALLTRRWLRVRRIIWGLAIYVGVYALTLLGVSLFSPQRVLAMHEIRCFDDWCIAVEQVDQRPAIGEVKPQGSFYLVTVQVSSQAKRISQRETDVGVYLLDSQGRRYNPDPLAQQALEVAGQAGEPLNTLMAPGDSFTHTAVFDLPEGISELGLAISHGAFPGLIIIANDQSLLHKPTIVRLPVQ